MLSHLKILLAATLLLFCCDCSTSRKIVNFPDTEYIESTQQNDTILLEWLDPITTSVFNLTLYSTTNLLADLSNISKAGTMSQIAQTPASITYNVTSAASFNLIKVYINSTAPIRFKITHTQALLNLSYFFYSVFAPPANKIVLVPFIITNSQACQYTFSRGSFVSSFNQTITVQLFRPGSNVLTGTPAYSFTIAPLARVLTPSMLSPAGTWHARFTTILKSKANLATGIAVQILTIYLNTFGCSNCNNRCYNNSYVEGAASNYFVVDQCYCGSGYLHNPVSNMCYKNCAVIAGVNATRFFNNEYNRCQCINTVEAYSFTTSSCTTNCSLLKNALKTQNKTVADICICNTNYTWSPADKMCVITCSKFPNTINKTKRVTTESCYCDSKFVWDYRNKRCSLNCSSISYTLCSSIYYLSPNLCTCIQGFVWDALGNQCVRDCSLISSATTFNPANLTQCLCAPQFIWSTVFDKCIRNCSIDLYANSLDSTNTSICTCLADLFWYDLANRCARNCSGDPYALGYNSADYSTCICWAEFQWSAEKSGCVRDCSVVSYSIGLSANDVSACACQSQFVWSTDIKRCVRDCSIDTNAVAYNSSDYSACICSTQYVWVSIIKLCVRNCSLDAHAIAYDPANVNACICVDRFQWDVSTCVRNCSNDTHSIRYDPANVSACTCVATFVWNLTLSQCTRNCQLDSNAISFDPQNVALCLCNIDLIWDVDHVMCARDCSSDPNAISSNFVNALACVCQTQFVWDVTLLKCKRDCSIDTNANTSDPQSDVNVCPCNDGFTWNSSVNKCVKVCAAVPYANGFNPSDVKICSCISNFVWNDTKEICVRNCAIDSQAKAYEPKDVSRCSCNHNFVWNIQSSSCIRNCCLDPNADSLNLSDYMACNCKFDYGWSDQLTRCTPNCSEANIENCVVNCQIQLTYLKNKNFCQNKCQSWELWNGYVCASICNQNQMAILYFQESSQEILHECIRSTLSLNRELAHKCNTSRSSYGVECQYSCPSPPYNYPIFTDAYNYANISYANFTNYTKNTEHAKSEYEQCRVLHNFQQEASGKSYILVQVFSYSEKVETTLLYDNFLVCPRGYALEATWNKIYNQLACLPFDASSPKCLKHQVLDSRNNDTTCVDLCKPNEIVQYVSNYYGFACLSQTVVDLLHPLGSSYSTNSQYSIQGHYLSVPIVVICSVLATLLFVGIVLLLAFKKFGLKFKIDKHQCEQQNRTASQSSKQSKQSKNQSGKQLKDQPIQE